VFEIIFINFKVLKIQYPVVFYHQQYLMRAPIQHPSPENPTATRLETAE
jgi:hypothetical protein